jgi:hypothetical protein
VSPPSVSERLRNPRYTCCSNKCFSQRRSGGVAARSPLRNVAELPPGVPPGSQDSPDSPRAISHHRFAIPHATFVAFVGPTLDQPLARIQAAQRPRSGQMEVRRFVASLPDSGPGLHEDCSEPISRNPRGRCSRRELGGGLPRQLTANQVPMP